MDCKDLMVGDFVSVSGKPVKITKDDLATMLIFLDDDSKINPFPLTEEILVKNGFERHPLWHHCTLEVGDGSKIYIPLACGGGIEYVSIYKHFEELTTRDIDIQIPIHYVHQLQHLMRLCGIEKELTI